MHPCDRTFRIRFCCWRHSLKIKTDTVCICARDVKIQLLFTGGSTSGRFFRHHGTRYGQSNITCLVQPVRVEGSTCCRTKVNLPNLLKCPFIWQYWNYWCTSLSNSDFSVCNTADFVTCTGEYIDNMKVESLLFVG